MRCFKIEDGIPSNIFVHDGCLWFVDLRKCKSNALNMQLQYYTNIVFMFTK